MDINDLIPIEGGSDKQKAFAQNVRLRYLHFLMTELDPSIIQDGLLVVKIRLDYKWWINHAKNINDAGVKTMIRSAKAAITRAGSIEDAIEAQRESIRKQLEAYREYSANSKMMFQV
jgi:hypothetical protein